MDQKEDHGWDGWDDVREWAICRLQWSWVRDLCDGWCSHPSKAPVWAKAGKSRAKWPSAPSPASSFPCPNRKKSESNSIQSASNSCGHSRTDTAKRAGGDKTASIRNQIKENGKKKEKKMDKYHHSGELMGNGSEMRSKSTIQRVQSNRVLTPSQFQPSRQWRLGAYTGVIQVNAGRNLPIWQPWASAPWLHIRKCIKRATTHLFFLTWSYQDVTMRHFLFHHSGPNLALEVKCVALKLRNSNNLSLESVLLSFFQHRYSINKVK